MVLTCLRRLVASLFSRPPPLQSPPSVPRHVPLVPYRQAGYHEAEPPVLRRNKTWNDARSAAAAMALAYPKDAVVQRYHTKVVREYDRFL